MNFAKRIRTFSEAKKSLTTFTYCVEVLNYSFATTIFTLPDYLSLYGACVSQVTSEHFLKFLAISTCFQTKVLRVRFFCIHISLFQKFL